MDDFQQEAQDVEDVVSDSPAESVEVESQEAKTEAPEPKVVFDEAQQAKVNSLISDKVAKTHEERRRGDELEKQIADLKAQIPQQVAPTVPTLPDPDGAYDDPAKFQKDMADWQTATKQSAEYDAQLVVQERQQAADAQRTAQEQQALFKKVEDDYAKNGESFGINESSLQQNAETVFNSGVGRDMVIHIAKDAQGALLMKHLNDNPLELDVFRSLPPFEQSQYLEATVRPKLEGARKATKAPKPAEVLGGAGVPEKVNRLIKDAVFSS